MNKHTQAHWRAIITALTIVLSTLITAPALAQLSVCSNPCVATQRIIPNADANVALRWRGEVALRESNDGDGLTITSKSGTFMIGNATSGTVLGTHSTPLQLNLAAPPRGTITSAFTINETLIVPARVSGRAQSLGANQLFYVRDFTTKGITLRASYIIPISRFAPNASESIQQGATQSATALGLNSIELQFNTGQKVEIIARQQSLKAKAIVYFDRAGRFDAVWEVATPETTVGTPVYKSLSSVRQHFAAGRQTALESPTLPSNVIGIHLIRLRVTTPASEQSLTPATLRYQVVAKGKQAIAPRKLNTLSLRSPAADVVVDDDTDFNWDKISGAKAYQIELFTSANPDTLRPLTGVQLPPKTTSAKLTATVFNRLISGKTYYWRVVAFDNDRRLLAASELRALKTSP